MDQESNPIAVLTAAKQKLVEERRTLAVAMALGYRRRRTDETHTNDMRETFIGIQTTIESIDRAIAHEKTIANRSTDSIVVPPLEVMASGMSGQSAPTV
ncbi:MAG TPA: hypothetical protein VGF53_09845 [Pseudolabrys sp.]|jgi:hypothetical protein